ncbi:MAG: hypothetical protein DRJ09_11860 [Bacteroidetes bacterium]|nr:MAG: hypothetical protein DRJ09_11860 [Bacteroidota bacterium]
MDIIVILNSLKTKVKYFPLISSQYKKRKEKLCMFDFRGCARSKLFKVGYLHNYEIHCKSENKFHYFPLWRENKGGVINKIFVF